MVEAILKELLNAPDTQLDKIYKNDIQEILNSKDITYVKIKTLTDKIVHEGGSSNFVVGVLDILLQELSNA